MGPTRPHALLLNLAHLLDHFFMLIFPTAVLAISIPVWVALLAWPILGERLSPVRAVSLAVALAGIAVLFSAWIGAPRSSHR